MKKYYFEDIYNLLEEEYTPYDFLYKGKSLKLKEIQKSANNYNIKKILDKGTSLVEKIVNTNYYPLFGDEVSYEYLVKLYYNREELYEALRNENLEINPNGRYVELSLNSIHFGDNEDDKDITELNNDMAKFFLKNWNPIIVDYPLLLKELDNNKIEHSFLSIEDMKEIVKEEGFVNPNPVIKKKIKRRYN